MGRRPKRTLLLRGYMNGQLTHEEMLNIINHERDAS